MCYHETIKPGVQGHHQGWTCPVCPPHFFLLNGFPETDTPPAPDTHFLRYKNHKNRASNAPKYAILREKFKYFSVEGNPLAARHSRSAP